MNHAKIVVAFFLAAIPIIGNAMELPRTSEEQEDMTKFKIIHRCKTCHKIYMSPLRLNQHFLNKHMHHITQKKTKVVTTAPSSIPGEQNPSNSTNNTWAQHSVHYTQVADNEVAQIISTWENQNKREPFTQRTKQSDR